jgi:hypothetical protein
MVGLISFFRTNGVFGRLLGLGSFSGRIRRPQLGRNTRYVVNLVAWSDLVSYQGDGRERGDDLGREPVAADTCAGYRSNQTHEVA